MQPTTASERPITGPSDTVIPPDRSPHQQPGPRHASSGWGAAPLVLSVKTVEFHLRHIFSKLGVRSRSPLILQFPKAGERVKVFP
ncbi:MAG: LuxR C-terminal-related transcriptional regulator [Pseudonocardiaceae bacterium]